MDENPYKPGTQAWYDFNTRRFLAEREEELTALDREEEALRKANVPLTKSELDQMLAAKESAPEEP